jgi:hypothetical protein
MAPSRWPVRGVGACAPDSIDRLSEALSIEVGGSSAAVRPARAIVSARARWWIEAATIAWLCFLYDATTNLAPLRLHEALANARGILSAEAALHLNPELALDHWLARHHTLAVVISNYYDNAHFVVTLGLLAWLWWSRSRRYRRLRNALVLVNVVAFVVFWLWPVAPPRMLTTEGFEDVVSSSHAFASFHSGALASHANQLAAMPSLHMAWAVWCAVVIWGLSRRVSLRALAILYPCATALAVIATGNHFVLDLVAGLLAIALAFAMASAPALLAALRGARSRLPAQRHGSVLDAGNEGLGSA